MEQTSRFRDLHTLTHEVELLISGALVFGMIEAPAYIESSFEWWVTRLDGLTFRAATYLFVYSEMLAYSLLATFILHLCLRGYWAALLGLESVWPTGWDPEKLKFGPYGRRVAARHFDSLSASIDRADDRASVIFAAGALLALVFVYSLVVVMLSIGAGLLLPVITAGRVSSAVGLLVTMAVVFLFTIVPPLIDRRYGHRIPADAATGRWFEKVLGRATRLSPARWSGPIQFVFHTHLGERRVAVAVFAAAGLLGLVLVAGLVWRSGEFRVDGWTYFNDSPAVAYFDPRYYRNSTAARDGLLPSIDAEVIAGPYLRLYLPYRPRRHNPVLAKRCPQPANATAECVGGMYRISMGDRPLTGLAFDFTRDMPSEFLGVVTFIDVRDLPRGRHELTVDGPPRSNGAAVTVKIPFYRE
jgi:hypothetical protein